MANEQNEQAQDIQNEQAEQSNEQTQAEGVEQANDVTVESLQAQITKLEENLKLEKARTANAVYEAQKSVERIQRESEKHKKLCLKNLQKNCWTLSTI